MSAACLWSEKAHRESSIAKVSARLEIACTSRVHPSVACHSEENSRLSIARSIRALTGQAHSRKGQADGALRLAAHPAVSPHPCSGHMNAPHSSSPRAGDLNDDAPILWSRKLAEMTDLHDQQLKAAMCLSHCADGGAHLRWPFSIASRLRLVSCSSTVDLARGEIH